jgi:hypothetical protein
MTVEWERLKRKRECAAYELSLTMFYSYRAFEANREEWHRKHDEALRNIAKYQGIAEAVAELCVQYNLPGGSPPWMCELIMSY